MKRKVKEASKFMSLEKLYEIRNDQYRGINGQEYYPESIDSLIWQKESSLDRQNMLKALSDMDKLHIGVIR